MHISRASENYVTFLGISRVAEEGLQIEVSLFLKRLLQGAGRLLDTSLYF